MKIVFWTTVYVCIVLAAGWLLARTTPYIEDIDEEWPDDEF